tara:strand:+ start:191 stop:886 length:696 start_codon:yes stop_codon:yes gene_type:complete
MRKSSTEGLTGHRLALVEAANKKGFNLKELSLSLARNHSYLYQFVKRGTPSELEFTDVIKLADILEVHPDTLSNKGAKAFERIAPTFLKVEGSVQAGAWREACSMLGDEYMELPIVPDPTYVGLDQYLLKVKGPSMNIPYPEDNAYVHCVAIKYQEDLYPVNGDHVIVERRRAGLVETTLKEYVMDNKGGKLWPRSTDANHQEPLLLGGHSDTDEIQIVAIVLSKIVPRAR